MTTQILTLIGPPAIAGAISAWLRDAKFPPWLNALVAFLVVFLTALIWTAIGNKLTGNLVADTMIVASFAGWLISGPMATLDRWLTVTWSSPFAAIAEAMSPVPVQAPPTPIAPPRVTLPTTPGLVGRTSMLNDPAWRPTTASPQVEPRPLQVPSVDSVSPQTSAAAQAITGPLPVVPPQTSTGDQGMQGHGADQGGQENTGSPPYSP